MMCGTHPVCLLFVPLDCESSAPRGHAKRRVLNPVSGSSPWPLTVYPRHALLVTDAALYMLAVHMFPRAKPGGEPGPRKEGMLDPVGKPKAPEQPTNARRAVTWAADRSSTSPEPVAKSGARPGTSVGLGDHERNGAGIEGEARGSGASANVGGGGARAREKRIRSIQMVTRWVPEQLSRVSLPFREVRYPLRCQSSTFDRS